MCEQVIRVERKRTKLQRPEIAAGKRAKNVCMTSLPIYIYVKTCYSIYDCRRVHNNTGDKRMHRMWSSCGADFDHHLDNNSIQPFKWWCQWKMVHICICICQVHSIVVHTFCLATIWTGSSNISAFHVKATHAHIATIDSSADAADVFPFSLLMQFGFENFGWIYVLNACTIKCNDI